MGGVSEGKFKITDKKTMEFFGTLSLEEQRRLRFRADQGQEARSGKR